MSNRMTNTFAKNSFAKKKTTEILCDTTNTNTVRKNPKAKNALCVLNGHVNIIIAR